MNNNKKLEDFLPEKNSVYFKSFDNIQENNKINANNIIDKIKTVFDPEIPVNIYDLGLIYNLNIDNEHNVEIKMTLTTPNCPVADSMPAKVGEAVSTLKGIASIRVELVWKPQWTKEMMSEDAKLALDIY